MSQTTFKQLVYNAITFNDLTDGVNPLFQCPICHHAWQPKLDLGSSFAATFDFNQKAAFTIPQHLNLETGNQCTTSNQQIELYVAVHKENAETSLCIQRSDAQGAAGIRANWWLHQ